MLPRQPDDIRVEHDLGTEVRVGAWLKIAVAVPMTRSLSPRRHPGAQQAYALEVSTQVPPASTNWSSNAQAVADGVPEPKLSVPRHSGLAGALVSS